MRLDKFLKNSRIIKRRTVAKEACESGKVKVNGRTAKPGTEVEEGDQLEIAFGSKLMQIEVLSTAEVVKKEEAGETYRLIGE